MRTPIGRPQASGRVAALAADSFPKRRPNPLPRAYYPYWAGLGPRRADDDLIFKFSRRGMRQWRCIANPSYVGDKRARELLAGLGGRGAKGGARAVKKRRTQARGNAPRARPQDDRHGSTPGDTCEAPPAAGGRLPKGGDRLTL